MSTRFTVGIGLYTAVAYGLLSVCTGFADAWWRSVRPMSLCRAVICGPVLRQSHYALHSVRLSVCLIGPSCIRSLSFSNSPL